jgi:hypothetical protein
MLKHLAICCILAGCASAQAQTPLSPAEVFAGLTGKCWSAQVADDAFDTHCLDAAVGGLLVTDTHKVRDGEGEVVYEGVTVYQLDKASGTLAYEYFNSLGAKLVGFGWRDGAEIRFGPAPRQETPELVWTPAADSYAVATPAKPGTIVRFELAPAG